MKLELSSVGNPDFGQNPNEPLWGCPLRNAEVEVDSFEQASLICQQFIAANELGGGNWSGGLITEVKKKLAFISYNGAAWKITKDAPQYSGKNEKIPLNLENPDSFKTTLTLVKKTNPYGDKCTHFHYKDDKGRDFFFRDTNTPFEYKLLAGTHSTYIDGYLFDLILDKFINQGIRQHDYKGGYDEAISKIEFYL